MELRPGALRRIHRFPRIHAESAFERHAPAPGDSIDLGDITLSATSAICGTVVDHAGAPVPGAHLSVYSEVFGSIGKKTQSDALGRYVLGHIPGGRFTVQVQASGFLDAFTPQVMAELHRDTLGVDFQLAAAPSIGGVVVDEKGAPVANQRIWAWPESTQGLSPVKSATTDRNGAFSFSIGKHTDYGLQISRRGFELLGQGADGRLRVEPGDEDLRIVLRRRPARVVRVMDAATDELITTFGVRVLKDHGSGGTRRRPSSRSLPEAQVHAGGSAKFYGEPGTDLLVVAADAYESFAGDVEMDSDDEWVQSVRLQPRKMLSGRVLRAGQPVEGAIVRLEHGEWKTFERMDGEGTAEVFVAASEHDVLVHSQGDGTFQVPVVDGTVRLVAKLGPTLVASSGPFVAKAGQTFELLLGAPGALEGKVLVPPGQAPEALKVMINDWASPVSTMTNSSGFFRIDGLPPGSYGAILRGRDPELKSTWPLAFNVEAGETTRANIDAVNLARATLALQVTVNGEIRPDIAIQVDTPDVLIREGVRVLGAFGHCDASGLVEGHVDVGKELLVGLYHPDLGELFQPDRLLTAEAATVNRRDVAFELATATLRLPEEAVLPKRGALTLTVLDPARRHRVATRSYSVEDGQLLDKRRYGGSLEGRLLHTPTLLAGSAVLRVDITDYDLMDAHDWSVPPEQPAPRHHAYECQHDLIRGDRSVIDLGAAGPLELNH